MSISSDPEERNSMSSRQSKISYTREYLLSIASSQSKISYTREYLLYLSDSETCRRLPEGFDESLLSEFRSLPEQQFRHIEYSATPPGKGDTGNISRGFQRWDNRASWRSDSDSQSDRDSDSGRRYGNQYKRSWQNPEHDGLLGSGSYPRPPGYGHGSSVPPSSANDQRQLNKNNDPYHPPRPYKVVPYSWKETKDSYNDETFGSAEDTGEDRVEEERKRRAEFEMMRKEQQKELKEQLKSKAMNKIKNDPLSELAASLDAEDKAIMTIGLDTSLVNPIQQNDSGKNSISSQGHPVRPLVPPGFANAAAEKISGPKSLGNPLIEAGQLQTGDDNQEKKLALHPRLDEKHSENAFLWASKGGTKVDLSSAFELSSKVEDHSDQSFGASKNAGIGEILDNNKAMGINPENDSGHKIVDEVSHSTSILEKLFEGAVNIKSVGPSSNIIEDHNGKAYVDLDPKDFHSSKFAQWFPEEEKKPVESGSSEKPTGLLSLIVGEKSGLITSDTTTTQQILLPESNMVNMGALAPRDAGLSDPLCSKNMPQRNSAVLTCEDLEQSIISSFGGTSSSSQPPGTIYSQHGLENETPTADINSNASQHLLSLLQKGTSSNSKTASPISDLDKGSPRESLDLGSERKTQGHSRNLNAENFSSGKGLTLETLFGTAFMNELHSFEAPSSVQRNYAESSSICVSEPSMLPVADAADGAVNTSVSDARLKRHLKDDSILGLGRAHQTNLENGLNWLTVDGAQKEVESSNLQRFDLHFPEQDCFTSLGFPVNAQSSRFTGNAEMLSSSSKTIVDVPEKLPALITSVKDERHIAGRQESSPFSRGPFDILKPEVPYPSMHAQSSPQFNPTMANHGSPIFPPLDPHIGHINPHFMPLEGINHQDAAIHHQISANLGHPPFRHPTSGLPQFDHPIHTMLQQMHIPNILPPAPLLPGFPGGAAPPPLHHGGNLPGYVQDHNLPRGFLFGQQQPNPVDLRVPLQGGEHGVVDTNPPQAFQRLLEMEVRSNQKQMHPPFPAAGGHSRPMYGHELDTGFWYR